MCIRDRFDAKVRYTGISFVYQFSGIFASGITPIIATAPVSYTRLDVYKRQPWKRVKAALKLAGWR